MATVMLSSQKKTLILARAVEATFSSSEWTEVGYLTETNEWIDRHPRLLRSLSWGDPDYKGHVIEAVNYILSKNKDNLRLLVEYAPITEWLRKNDGGSYHELGAEVSGMEVQHFEPQTTTDSGHQALADAQALLHTRGPGSAVDRIHTGLHAFLKAACDDATIPYPDDPSANQLLKLLLEHHPSLKDFGPRSDDIRRMIRTSASIVDSLGTLRNQASLAHPNEEILGHEEALFVINLARSLLRFLDAKVSGAG
jgi:AbiJ N-terminal domain 5/Abortive infection C-terminus